MIRKIIKYSSFPKIALNLARPVKLNVFKKVSKIPESIKNSAEHQPESLWLWGENKQAKDVAGGDGNEDFQNYRASTTQNIFEK